MSPVTLAQGSGLGAAICADPPSRYEAGRVQKIMEQTQNENKIHFFPTIFDVQADIFKLAVYPIFLKDKLQEQTSVSN